MGLYLLAKTLWVISLGPRILTQKNWQMKVVSTYTDHVNIWTNIDLKEIRKTGYTAKSSIIFDLHLCQRVPYLPLTPFYKIL